MHWFRRASQNAPVKRFASRTEIQAVFVEQKESLYWTTLLITADPITAAQSFVDATGLAQTKNYLCRDWLLHWAHTATARAALQTVSELIRAAAEQYESWNCSHSSHDPLSHEEITKLQTFDPREIAEALDPLSRTVLILRGCQHASLADCALLLRVSLRCVLGGYCRALQWCDKTLHVSPAIPEDHHISCEPEVQME